MDPNNVDHIIRDALYDHKTAIDKDLLWSAIESKKSRSKLVLISSISLMMLFVSFGIFWMSSYSSPIQEISSTELSTIKNVKTDEQSQSNTLATNLNSGSTELNEKIASQPEPKIFEKANSLSQEELLNEKSNTTLEVNKPKINTKTSLASTKKINQNNLTSVITKSENETPVLLKEKTLIQSTDILANQNNTTLLDPLAVIQTQGSKPLSSEKTIFKNYNKIECYEHGKKPNQLFVEFYGLVDLVSKSMDTGQENMSYLQERKKTQTQLEGYRSGIRFKYLFNNGLYFKSGLEAGMIRERFDKQETTESVKTLPNQLLETIERNDTTIYIYGDAPVTYIETKTWKIWNTYRSIGVPLLAGFQYHRNKLSYGIEFGAIYNLFYDFEGFLLDPADLQPIEASNYFKKDINTSLTGGFSVGYSLTNKYRLLFQSSFKKNLSGINSIENNINQSNVRFGLGFGLEMKLW